MPKSNPSPDSRPASGLPWAPRLFWLLSRLFVAVYGHLPVFGSLRTAAAVIQREGRYLVVDRSDGRGLGFPGGIAMPWEDERRAMERETEEETGMRVTAAEFWFRYRVRQPIPCWIAVYQASAEGQVRDSWEGRPFWADAAEVQRRVFESHATIADRLPAPLGAPRGADRS
ncbi:MAG: NUDIX domain-containing protein [Terriglobales bacterium]